MTTPTPEEQAIDTLLLKTILVEEIGTIANIIQAASELEGTMTLRLSVAYYECTNQDPGADSDTIGLKP